MQKCTTCPKANCPFQKAGIKISGFSLLIVGCKITYRGEQIFDLSWLTGGKPFMRLRKSQIQKALLKPENDQMAS